MFHPLLPNMADYTDAEIEQKISELGKKYSIAARYGDGSVCSQILIVLESYKDEQRKRLSDKSRIPMKNSDQDKDLDDLINID